MTRKTARPDRRPHTPLVGQSDHLSRTRCSVLHAAPQSRDPGLTKIAGPRPCSAPLRNGHSASKTRVNALMALRCVGGTLRRLRRLVLQQFQGSRAMADTSKIKEHMDVI